MPKMNRNLLGMGLALSCLAVGMAAADQKTRLPATYQKWLVEEVPYIIRPLERDVFLKLQTDRERNLFIEAFCKQRDPSPGTPENEFKTEHYRRINYANRTFSRSAPFPVDVEYSANYMDSESLIKLVKDPSGIYFVHYAVEPKRISVDACEKTYTLT